MRKSKIRPCRCCGKDPELIYAAMSADDFKVMCRNPKCADRPRTEWRETRARAVYDWNNGLYMTGEIPVLANVPKAGNIHKRK